MISEPRVCLLVGLQHSRFLSILTRFVDYYSLFWGPVVISMIDKPRGVSHQRSRFLSILTRFVDYYSSF